MIFTMSSPLEFFVRLFDTLAIMRGEVLVSFQRCACAGGGSGAGHLVTLCRRCGWEAWPGCEMGSGEQVELPTSLRIEQQR